MKKKPFKQNKNEIKYNLINCALSAGLVFLGGLSTGKISKEVIGFSLITGLIVFLTKFKNYWASEKKEYINKIFNFI